MPTDSANHLYRVTFILILTLAVAAAFLIVIRAFVLDILLAAIFAGTIYPLFEKSLPVFGGRRAVAAIVVVVISILAVALPLSAIVTLVGSEAIQSSEAAIAWIRQTVAHPQQLLALLPDWLVQAKWLQTAISSFTTHIADIINALSGFLSRSLSSVTHGAIRFFLDLLVMSFALSYFLQHGPVLVEHLIDRIPVARAEARVVVDKALLITAATLKSIVVAGTAQGVLIGIAFAIVGIGQPWFWGTVMAVMTTVPVLGSGAVWAPAAIYLVLTGHTAAGVGLALWGLVVVSIVDESIRIYVVGRGAALPNFLVFVSTLGGLTVLGPPGLLIGPVLAGVLLGVLDLYQTVLKSSGLSNDPE